MERLIRSIEQSLQEKNWYAALTVALILPDICGKIDIPKGISGDRYEAWFDKYVRKEYVLNTDDDFAIMSGGDCYAIRCAMLHEFSEDLSSHKARDIISKYSFCSPDYSKYSCVFSPDLENEMTTITMSNIRVDVFCHKIIKGVRCWQQESNFNEGNFIGVRIFEKVACGRLVNP